MKISVYADESGTHDETGVQKGSREAVLGGIVGLRDDWKRFCAAWQLVLNKYRAPYFHFTEWASASAVARQVRNPEAEFNKNPYRGWNKTTLDEFLIELASLVGSGDKLIVGGAVHTNIFNQWKREGKISADDHPYAHYVDQFFITVAGTIEIQKPPWKRMPISFFFDRSDHHTFNNFILEKFALYKVKHPTFKEIAFANKKEQPHIPLQAADMVAYRTRQITEKWVDGEQFRPWSELDNALFKSTFDFLETHKSEVLVSYLRGELDYGYLGKRLFTDD